MVSQKIQRINLSSIERDPDLQSRAAMCDLAIAEYAETYSTGSPDSLPPIVVFRDPDGKLWLADGWQRMAAAEIARKKNLPAEVREGTRRDAMLYACGANAGHGVRRSNADKRRAVEMLLSDAEWAAKSDSWIAQQCKVSQPFVGKVRPELAITSSPESQQGITVIPCERRKGRDGKTYSRRTSSAGPTPKEQLRQHFEKPVATAEEEPAAEEHPAELIKTSTAAIVQDALHRNVPDRLRDAHQQIPKLLDMNRRLSAVLKDAEELAAVPGGELLAGNFAYIRQGLEALKGTLLDARYWTACPRCDAAGCERCQQRGWLSFSQKGTLSAEDKQALGVP